MAKVKTGDLIDAALDWMVAKADENLYPKGDVRLLDGKVFTIEAGDYERSDRWQRYSPSTSWAQGGPILERERIGLWPSDSIEGMWAARPDYEVYPERLPPAYGPTPLIAAMRCFCCSKLGDTVEVPEELTCSPTPKND